MKKYTDRERKLIRNVRKLLDMLTHPTLYTFLTTSENKMVNKIKQEIKSI
jgi:hypothetical protein